MKKSLSFLAAAATATVVLLSVPSSAKAQVAFGGTFRGPHGAFSIGVGPFVPQVGVYVPSPYYDEVYLDPDYGYGFYYDSQWIPCIRYGSRWIIARRPVVYGRGAYGYGYARPYGSQGRVYGFEGRRGFQGRREFQGQGRREFQGQGRRQFQGQGRREFQGQGRREFQGQGRREFQGQGQRQFQGQGRREFQGQGRQDRGSRSNGNRQSNRDTRRGGDGRQ
jgi:hypothetical protein